MQNGRVSRTGDGRVKKFVTRAGREGEDVHGGFRAGDSYGWDYDIIKYFKPNMFSQMDLYLLLNSSSYNSFVLQIYMKHISDHFLWVKNEPRSVALLECMDAMIIILKGICDKFYCKSDVDKINFC